MNTETPNGADQYSAEEGSVPELLRAAGRRAGPSAAATLRIHDQLMRVWSVEVQRRRQRFSFAAAAALVVCTVAVLLWMSPRTTPSVEYSARIVRTLGHVQIRIAGSSATAASGQQVAVPSELSVPEAGGIHLQLSGSQSIRLGPATHAQLLTANRIRLDQGQLYVDSGTGADQAPLIVETRLGRVRHLGTRFCVRIESDRMDVQVRDGRVEIASSALTTQVGPQSRVSVSGSGKELVRTDIASAGPDWAWVDALAAPIIVDNQTLPTVLQSIAHERGLRIEYADDATRLAAGEVILHGPPLAMPLDQALVVVLTATELRASTDAQRILIRTAATDQAAIPEDR